MRDYKDGKIYKIVCDNTGLTYYGSTCEKHLSRRLSRHRNNYSYYLQVVTCCFYNILFECLEFYYNFLCGIFYTFHLYVLCFFDCNQLNNFLFVF